MNQADKLINSWSKSFGSKLPCLAHRSIFEKKSFKWYKCKSTFFQNGVSFSSNWQNSKCLGSYMYNIELPQNFASDLNEKCHQVALLVRKAESKHENENISSQFWSSNWINFEKPYKNLYFLKSVCGFSKLIQLELQGWPQNY